MDIQKLIALAVEKKDDGVNNIIIDVALSASEYASLAPLRKGARYETICKQQKVKSKFILALIEMREYAKSKDTLEDVSKMAEEIRKKLVLPNKKEK